MAFFEHRFSPFQRKPMVIVLTTKQNDHNAIQQDEAWAYSQKDEEQVLQALGA